jgi:hypothetical protein
MSPLQQTNRLPVARNVKCVSAFRFWMKFILSDNISVRFDSRDISCSVVTARRDAKPFPGVLINPLLFEPFPRIRIVGGNQMTFFGINALRDGRKD